MKRIDDVWWLFLLSLLHPWVHGPLLHLFWLVMPCTAAFGISRRLFDLHLTRRGPGCVLIISQAPFAMAHGPPGMHSCAPDDSRSTRISSRHGCCIGSHTRVGGSPALHDGDYCPHRRQ